MTLDEFARSVGYSYSHLSNVERGERKASEELIRRYEGLAGGGGHLAMQSAVRVGRAAGGWNREDGADDDFGSRVMRLRIANGWSLALLAGKANISRSYLGKLENGRASPSKPVAEACDNAFEANGELVRLAGARRRRTATVPHPSEPDDCGGDVVPNPEELLLTASNTLRDLRRAAQREGPFGVIPTLAGEARTLASVASVLGGARGRRLWLLAARYAEFAGWMIQESGRDDVADQWTVVAARWASLGGDGDMASYLWERRALMALYRGDAKATVELARRGASDRSATSRVRGLAERREAQGHALAGDAVACMRALDRAAMLLANGPAPFPVGSSWGPNTIDDASTSVEAWCLVDLGRHRRAVELFAADPAPALPAALARTRGRFAVREALALVGAGDVDQACDLVAGLLPGVARIDSATVRVDLRRLIGAFNRQRRHTRAQALLPTLHNLVRPIRVLTGEPGCRASS